MDFAVEVVGVEPDRHPLGAMVRQLRRPIPVTLQRQLAGLAIGEAILGGQQRQALLFRRRLADRRDRVGRGEDIVEAMTPLRGFGTAVGLGVVRGDSGIDQGAELVDRDGARSVVLGFASGLLPVYAPPSPDA